MTTAKARKPKSAKAKSDRPSPSAVRELMDRFYSWQYEKAMRLAISRKVFKRFRGRGFMVKA